MDVSFVLLSKIFHNKELWFYTEKLKVKSNTIYHHIMIRGIKRSNIFKSNNGKTFFKIRQNLHKHQRSKWEIRIGGSIIRRALKK